MLITIEGLDGTGKHTQSVLLHEAIEGSELIGFPQYESESSSLVKMYLQGRITDDPNKVNPYLASLFYACDRAIDNTMKEWSKDIDNKIVISDRYTGSNYIHQMSKLPKSEWSDYMKFIEELEYKKLNIPKPDMTFYLYLPTQISQDLMNKRYNNNESSKDIHEKNMDYLTQCISAIPYLKKHLHWIIIDETTKDENGEIIVKDPETIHKEIRRYISDLISTSNRFMYYNKDIMERLRYDF